MSKLITRLETLTAYKNKFETLETQSTILRDQNKTLTDEFSKWMMSEFGFNDGPQSLPKILLTALESSYDAAPTQSIITAP